MSNIYNTCPDCGSVRKRHMPLGDKKLCIDCYEEYAIDSFLDRENEKNDAKIQP